MPFRKHNFSVGSRKNFFKILSGFLAGVYVFSLALPGVVFATQGQNDVSQTQSAKHEPKRGTNPETGKVSFIGDGDPIHVPGVSDVPGISSSARALGLANAYGEEFGLKNPSQELKLIRNEKDKNGKEISRFQQTYRGLPVIAAEIIVNANAKGELLSISGEVSSDLSLDTKPVFKAEYVERLALTEIARLHQVDEKTLVSTRPELSIFDESLLTASTRPVELVWHMEVTAKDSTKLIREMVLVSAQTGAISFHINQVDTAHVAEQETTQIVSVNQELAASATSSQVRYIDLVVDEARNRLYGADKTGNKIDVIDISDLSVINSFTLASGSLPSGIDLSPDGNELAVAQSGLDRVKFINLMDGAMSDLPAALSGPSTKPTDVVYGRPGTLYALSSNGFHVINTAIVPHAEDATQYTAGTESYEERYGILSSDGNTLYYVTGTCCTGYNSLNKYDVSQGLPTPVLLGKTHLYETGSRRTLRLSLLDDNTLLISSGSVYNTSTLTPKAKNGQGFSPAVALTGRNFYVTVYDNASGTDTLNFFDKDSSYLVSTLTTGIVGTPGAIAVASDGDTLFVSSTGGMSKFEIGVTAPGTPISLPQSLKQYKDFAFDMPRGVIYGTDASNRVETLDQNTGAILNSYLLPNGASPRGIDLSPDGSELAIALNGLEKILFINPETGATIAEVTPQIADSIYYTNLPYDVIYGRTGRLYSDGLGGTDRIHVFDTTTHTWLAKSTYSVDTGAELAITADKNYLYANSTYSPNNIHVFDARTDSLTKLYQGPHGPVAAMKITVTPDGNKLFTPSQVWSGNMQEQLGNLEGGAGNLVEYIPGQDAVVIAAQDANGSLLRFISATNYRLLTTYRPVYAGNILEMEMAPDGSQLIVNFSSGNILILDISTILPVPPSPPPAPALATIQYADLVVDEARDRLYGADKTGHKIDVINMSDLQVINSYLLVYGAFPTSIELSPDGNELAVAQSNLSRVAFIDLTNDTFSEMSSPLSGSNTKGYDVLYGRSGILYILSTSGLHTISTLTHSEDTSQYVAISSDDKFGAITSDKNSLFFVSVSPYSLYKFDVSARLPRPVQLSSLSAASHNNYRPNLVDDSTLLTSWGSNYDVSTFTLKARIGLVSLPVIGLPGRDFYATVYNNASGPDTLDFFDEQNAYKVSTLSTGISGTPGALAVTNNGSTLFVSSTGGMIRQEIGTNPPGTPVNVPQSLKQYRDFAFDLPRGVIYGTDASGRIDVIDQNTGTLLDSYLLSNGANPIGIDLSPDGGELAVALNGLETILFINPETGAEIARVKPLGIESPNVPYDVIYGRAGRLYSNGNPGSGGIDYIHVIDTLTHSWVTRSPYPNTLRTGAEFAITSDQNYLYANQTFSPSNVYVFDIRTDTVTKLYQGPHGPVSASKFTIAPDSSKVFTSNGQVWSGDMQSQLGTLQGGPGNLIDFVPSQNAVALTVGNSIKFISGSDYQLLSTYYTPYSGNALEMEIAPDGSKLIANYSGGILFLLDIKKFPPPTPIPSSTPTFTPSSTPTLTRTATLTRTPTLTGTPYTPLPSSTPLPTFTAGPGPSRTPGPSATAGPSPTPVPTDSTGSRWTYTAGGSYTIPGSFLCDENQSSCTNGGDLDADNAHEYAADTFVFYNTHHQRNSFDNQGGTIISTVNYGIGYQNAGWTGYQMVYGDGMAADDVVGHEITHGVTQYTSNLIYAYQSGAINESFSDVWGEFIDQTNGSGNDSASVKWLMGEDTPMGAIRSLSNPPAYGHPDTMSSPYYYDGPYDNGGVHINSGVNNKAAYLMVEGGSFNNRVINGIGLNKTAAVYYEAQMHLLTMGANYNDLYYALVQGCQNLIGGTDGITSFDCEQVRLAAEAVEMVPEPPVTATPTATFTATNTATPAIFTLNLQPDGTAGVDSMIYSGSKTTNFGAGVDLGVGEDNTANNRIARSLLRFDLSSIPANATITSATLSLWTSSDLSSNTRTIRVYRLKTAFNESQVTWSRPANGVSWQLAGASGLNDRESTDIGSLSILDNEALNVEKQIVLSPAKIQELVNGTFANRGFLIAADTEINDRFNYKSSDSTTANQRPKLVVQYTLGSVTPTDTPTLTPSPTLSPTSTEVSVTPSFTATATHTLTATPTATASPTGVVSTPTDTATFTPSPTFTPTHTATPSATFTATATATRTSTATTTPSPTHTFTPSPTTAAGFPITVVRDTFNRANGSIGTGWSGYPGAFSIASNQLDVVATGTNTYLLWNSASFGTDQEAYITLSQIDTNPGNEHRLILKSQSNKNVTTGLITVRYDAAGQTVQVWTYHSTQGWVQQGTSIPVTFVNGDQLGARARPDGTVEIFRNGTLIGTRSVTAWPAYANGGYIGLWMVNAPNAVLDNFGGGTR